MIKVLHNKNFLQYPFNKNINKKELEEVAEVQTEDLEEAFGFTQNIEYSWTECTRVTAKENKEYRSTSAGDVLIHNEKYFVVEIVGFKEINFN